jgi:hypothetical protein
MQAVTEVWTGGGRNWIQPQYSNLPLFFIDIFIKFFGGDGNISLYHFIIPFLSIPYHYHSFLYHSNREVNEKLFQTYLLNEFSK